MKDIYFDEEDWVVRYLVVNTQKWLPLRKVLVSPITFDYIDEQKNHVNILETKERIKESPEIGEEEPVSRQKEMSLGMYYGWPSYWGGPDVWGSQPTPKQLAAMGIPEEMERTIEAGSENKLRSVNEIKGDFTGYKIHALDGEIGHVSDFIVDDFNWKIRYLIVETRNWWPGEFVTLSTDWITGIDWSKKEVRVDLDKDTIKNGPTFDPHKPMSREDEEAIYTSYGKAKYWE